MNSVFLDLLMCIPRHRFLMSWLTALHYTVQNYCSPTCRGTSQGTQWIWILFPYKYVLQLLSTCPCIPMLIHKRPVFMFAKHRKHSSTSLPNHFIRKTEAVSDTGRGRAQVRLPALDLPHNTH